MIMPKGFAIPLTFAVSGLIHDVILMAVLQKLLFPLVMVAFSLIGIALVIESALGFSLIAVKRQFRPAYHAVVICSGFAIAFLIRSLLD